MRSIRAGRGLGDAIYLQSIVRHFVQGGEPLEVCTDWPLLFSPFGEMVKVVPFRRIGTDLVAHYTTRKGVSGTDQFRDCCLSAGIEQEIEFRLEWTPSPCPLLSRTAKPIVLLQMYREPFDRSDGYGLELLPRSERLQQAIDVVAEKALVVQVGKGRRLHGFRNVLDLTGRTSLGALLDLACRADGFLGYCSFFAPLAEALNKPALFIWSRRGLRSRQEYLRTITPDKVLRLPSSLWVVDDCLDVDLVEAANALLVAAGSR